MKPSSQMIFIEHGTIDRWCVSQHLPRWGDGKERLGWCQLYVSQLQASSSNRACKGTGDFNNAIRWLDWSLTPATDGVLARCVLEDYRWARHGTVSVADRICSRSVPWSSTVEPCWVYRGWFRNASKRACEQCGYDHKSISEFRMTALVLCDER